MSTLHTVNKSPFGNGTLLSCLRHCKPGDAIVLIEDGVYGAIAGTGAAGIVAASLGAVSLHVLDADARARGIAPGRMMEGARMVDYGGFVDLVAEHDRTQAWL